MRGDEPNISITRLAYPRFVIRALVLIAVAALAASGATVSTIPARTS